MKPAISAMWQPVVLVVFLILLVAGCSDSDTTADSNSYSDQPADSQRFRFSGAAMGTVYNVIVEGAAPEQLEAIKTLVTSRLNEVNKAMSTYRDDSELMQVNRKPVNTPVSLSPELGQVLQAAARVYQDSSGAFDVTVGPLVDLWGFGAKDTNTQPTPEDIRGALANVGADALQLSPKAGSDKKADSEWVLLKTQPRQIDLSAIAKGFSVDQIASGLDVMGVTRYMIEVGGEIRVGAPKLNGEPWTLAVESPQEGSRQVDSIIPLTHNSIATSGNYRNFIEVNGQRWAHFIDPRTGRPVPQELVSVTVIHKESMMADAYATALSVMGRQAALALAERISLAVYLIEQTTDGWVKHYSTAFAPYRQKTE